MSFEEDIKDPEKLQNYVNAYVKMASVLYLNDLLSDADIQDHDKIIKKIIELRGEADLNVKVDFRPGVLKIARNLKKKKNYMFAKVFYQMYFEHTINSIIVYSCDEKNVSKESESQIIRRVNWDGKFTWVLELLGLPQIDSHHLKIISRVNEARNYIAHYKFKSTPLNESTNYNEKKEAEEIDMIEKTILYMAKYEKEIKKRDLEKLKKFKKHFFKNK
jgi:hypothetical protein